MEIAVETWVWIAFANDNEEPAKGDREGLLMPRRAVGYGRAVTVLMAARVAGRAVGASGELGDFQSTMPDFLGVRMPRALNRHL